MLVEINKCQLFVVKIQGIYIDCKLFFFRYCEDSNVFSWTNNTSKWPVCEKPSEIIPKRELHMQCEISGRPCCIQVFNLLFLIFLDAWSMSNNYKRIL